MEGFESCSYIEHGMVLDHCNRIRSCNNFNPRYGGRPIIYENYHGEKIDWKEFFEIKRELRNKYRNNSCYENHYNKESRTNCCNAGNEAQYVVWK